VRLPPRNQNEGRSLGNCVALDKIVDIHWIKHMKYLRISLATQFLLAVYFQIINWFPLGLWNYQPGFVPLINSRMIEWGDVGVDCLFLLPFLLFSLAYWRNWKWLMWVGVAGYGGWLFLQIQTWWIPYIFGASDRWEATYRRVFARTTQILPSYGSHLAPDGMHLVIQILLVVILVTLIAGLFHTRRSTVH
jgi:hypothetical protein